MMKSKAFRVLLTSLMILSALTVNASQIGAEDIYEEEIINETSEEPIPEITGERVLEEKTPRYETRVNYDDVCRGGNNPHNTDKRSQDPNTKKMYWDYDDPSFTNAFSEKDLIGMIWPKSGGDSVNHGYRLPDAVISPDDQCFYANEKNGWGESVSGSEYLKDTYWRYTSTWSQPIGYKQTPNPVGSQRNPYTGKPNNNPDYNDIRYAGNYRWQNNSGGYLFTIVVRPKMRVSLHGNYNSPYTGKGVGQYYINGNSHPRIFDITGKREEEHNIKTSKIMYKFEGVMNDGNPVRAGDTFYSKPSMSGYNGSTQWRKTPTKPGWYKMTAQVQEDKDQFILPGRLEDYVIYMEKGYKTKFVQKIDGGPEGTVAWVPGKNPEPFDQRTKDMFGIEFYLDNKTHKIPIPQYDETKYIFEGWTAYEEYWQPEYDGAFIGSFKTREIDLNKGNDGNYIYQPTQIDANQHFVLNTKLVAKLRTRKTNTVNTELSFINDESGLKTDEKATLNMHSIVLKELITNSNQFMVELKDLPFEFIGYSKNADGSDPLSKNNNWNPADQLNPDNQVENNKVTNIKAVISAKPITIEFDPNGGQLKNGQKANPTISSHYYKSPMINQDSFQKEGYVLQGWSETPNGDVVVTNGNQYKINAVKEKGSYPSKKTLYAKWSRSVAKVNVHKHKDTLWVPGSIWDSTSGNIFVKPPQTTVSTAYNAYEITRFYLDVDMAGLNTPVKDLDKTKFYVVWERSTDGGKKFEKMKLNQYSSFFTVPFTDDNSLRVGSKVVYDEAKGKWFVPLLVRANYADTQQNIGGIYRVSVAYDDPKATERISTEQEFYEGTGIKGWTTSDPTEVKVVQTFDTVVNVPASITLTEKKEGTKEVIESVTKSNKVTVKGIQHSITQQEDTDWHTPSNAMVGKTTSANSYNGGQHKEYMEQKPYAVLINWDSTLIDTTQQYRIRNIDLYSAENIGNMRTNQKIPSGTKSTFKLDGNSNNQVLFNFYLKGDKPAHLPDGAVFKGKITFRISKD